MSKVRKLRFHMVIPLLVVFLLLWAGSMVLLTGSTRRTLEATAQQGKAGFLYRVEEQMSFYEKNRHSDRPDAQAWAEALMTYNLNASPLWEVDGGFAWVIRENGEIVMESQITTGYAHQAGVDQGDRWHLDFDTGLDDEGQLALARWIAQAPGASRSGSGNYSLRPTGSPQDSQKQPWDGTFARITGEVCPGQVLIVDRLELVHPDGTVELVTETGHRSAAPVTMDFKFLRLATVLLPVWNSKTGFQDWLPGLEKRLERFREAQSKLSRDVNITFDTAMACDVDALAFRQLRFVYLGTFLLTLAALFLLAHILSAKVNEPVEALCRQTDTGHCEEQNPVSELNTLARAINRSHERMEEQLRRERDFTRAAAHELKTPLAVLRTHAEALREDIDPAKRDQYLDVVLDETDSMAQLISSLLELSRLENGVPLDMEYLDLSALIRSVFAPLTLPMERKGMTLSLDLSEVWLSCDPARIKSAVDNLASNALRYGSEGGRVEVALVQEENTARLTVYNDGPPIPEEHLPHLFEPFYRVDKARSRDLGGTGLGLAIVKAAAAAHGGTCTVANVENGVKFTLTLPAS